MNAYLSSSNLLEALTILVEAITYQRIARKQALHRKAIEKEAARFFRRQGLAYGRALADQTKLTEADSTALHTAFDSAVGVDLGTLANAILKCYVSGMTFANTVYALGITFTLKNPRAVKYQVDHGIELLAELNKKTQSDINAIIIDGLEQGLSTEKIARQIKRLFVSYATKPKGRQSRAEIVARTETARAYSAGNHGAILDASGTGLEFEKSWLTVGDNRVDSHCQANQRDSWIAMGQAHSSGAQFPPDHPLCRCVERYRRIASDIPIASQTQTTKITSTALPDDHPLLKRFGSDSDQYRTFSDPGSTDSIFGEKYFRSWEEALTDNQRNAIRGYQQQTFGLINDTLRGHREEDTKTAYAYEQIAILDQALASARMPMNITAYRGFVDPDLNVGDTYTDLGYSSTTLAPAIAVARAKGHTNGAVARIKLPLGTTGAYVETVTAIDQAEVLLPRGQTFKIVAITDETLAGSTVTVIDVELVG